MGARGFVGGAGARSQDQPPAVGTAGYPTRASAAAGAVAPLAHQTGDLVGNPGPTIGAGIPRAPAHSTQTFKLKYRGPVGPKVLTLAWEPRKSWRTYLREKRLIEVWVQHRSVDTETRKKVRLGDEPYPGQVVELR